MAELIFSDDAASDLDLILDYLAREAGAPVAIRYGERFRAAFRQLTDFPGSGSPRRQFGETMRVWSVPPYLIFYRYSRGDVDVRVVRIIDGRRKISDKLLGRS